MDHQATLTERRRHDSSAQALTQSLANIAHDMVTIAELQARLLAVDLQGLRQGAQHGVVTLAIACGVLVAVLPTALIGMGLWLADVAHVSTAAGLLWISLGAVLFVIGLSLAGWRQLKRQGVGLQRSRNELRASLAAMKEVLSSYADRESAD